MGFRACELQLSFRVTAEGQGAWQIFLGFRFMLLVVRGLEGLWVKAVELESSVPGWWMAGSAVGKMALRQCVCVCRHASTLGPRILRGCRTDKAPSPSRSLVHQSCIGNPQTLQST